MKQHKNRRYRVSEQIHFFIIQFYSIVRFHSIVQHKLLTLLNFIKFLFLVFFHFDNKERRKQHELINEKKTKNHLYRKAN